VHLAGTYSCEMEHNVLTGAGVHHRKTCECARLLNQLPHYGARAGAGQAMYFYIRAIVGSELLYPIVKVLGGMEVTYDA